MVSSVLTRHSLKTKITLTTLSIFVASIWSLAFYTSHMLREDMQRVLGEQQLSTVSFMASEINQSIEDRINALELIARAIGPELQNTPATLQNFLDQRFVLHSQFNAGVFVVTNEGMAIVDSPVSSGRVGSSFIEVGAIASALKDGKPAIGRPIVSKVLHTPVINMAVPLRNKQGEVIGALAGSTNLGVPNFLDKIETSSYGKTGQYNLVAPQYRLIVTSSRKDRIMSTLPERGFFPGVDRILDGYEGTSIYVNPSGVEVLASTKRIPSGNWIVHTSLATEEAFVPIRAMQQRTLSAAAILTLLAGLLTWWMLKRQLSPMLAALEKLVALSSMGESVSPLPITRNDEIGSLIAGFNHLLDLLGQRETALQESEERFRSLHDASFGGIAIHENGRILDCNQGLADLSGYSIDELVGMDGLQLMEPASRELVVHNIRAGSELPYDAEGVRKDGSVFQVSIRAKNIPYKGRIVRVTEFQDISARKQAEEKLVRMMVRLRESEQKLSEILENVDAFIYLKDTQGRYLFANRRVRELFGLPMEEIVGQGDEKFFDADTTENIHNNDRLVLEKGETVRVEETNLGLRDSLVTTYLSVKLPLRNASGEIYALCGISTDITERKRLEDEVRQLAFHDSLTKLPNRRLLNDRLSLAMATSKRNGCHGALMFLDLDNFKTLNDTHGHEVGDLLLIEAAARLKSCVREIDTVARFGGDEFVVMISELSTEREQSIAQASQIAEKIRSILSEPYFLLVKEEGVAEATIEHRCTTSIGLTLFLGDEANQDDIIKTADTAMYQAKESGRNFVQIAQTMPHAGYEDRNAPNSFVKLYWHSAYQSGNALIDSQHRQLFADANRILDAILDGQSAEMLSTLISTLLRDVVKHFEDEEAIFTAACFPGAAEHASIHRHLADSAVILVGRFHNGSVSLGELFQFLAHDMVARHLLGVDREFFPYLKTPH